MKVDLLDPIFILGVPRSGTSLLRVLLDSHSQLLGAPETGWITGGYGNFSLRQLVESLSSDPIGAVENLDGVDEAAIYKSSRVFISSILSNYLNNSGKKRLILKTPDDIRHLDFLGSLFPNISYIHIYRDGRDVASSTYRQKGQFFGDDVLQEYGELTRLNALRRWVDWEVRIKDFLSSKKCKVLHCSYEQLVNEPKVVLVKICEFLNVNFEESMIDYQNHQHSFPDWEAGSKDVKNKDKIDTSRVGVWQRSLSASQWKEADSIAGDVLEMLGYEKCEELAKHNEKYLLSVLEETEGLINKQSETNKSIRQQLDALAEENRLLHQSHQTITDLNTELSDLKSKVKVYENEVGTRDETIANLNTELSDLKSKVKVYENEVGARDETIANLKTELTDLKSKVKSYENEAGARDETITNLNSELTGWNATLKDHESKVRELVRQVSTFEERLDKKGKEAVISQQEVNKLVQLRQEDKKNWHTNKARLEAEIQQKCKTITQLNTQLSSFKAMVRQLDEDKHQAIQRVFESPTFRVGKIITSPARAVKRIVSHKSADSQKHQPNQTKFIAKNSIDLGRQLEGFYGNHRSGWSHAVASLAPLQNPDGIYLDTFIEKTFVWSPDGVKPHKRPWIGFIHVPPNIPEWFQYEQSNQAIFRTPAWNESLPYCRGLYTLSEYHKRALEKQFDFPIENLIHPTEIPEKNWSWDRFEKNSDKKIIQLGWWLRKLHAIFQLPQSKYRKVMLKTTEQKYLQDLLEIEKKLLINAGEFDESMYDSVDIVSYLQDKEYDDWLSENIGFMNLYDSSANNVIIECIARGTPLLVNPLEPVVEYLGKDYPLYYDSYADAVSKASDYKIVKFAHDYLLNLPLRAKLSGDYFRECVQNSRILLELDKC